MTAQKKALPGWPKMMRLSLAAAYVDLTEQAFLREILRGVMPHPITLDGKERWSRTAIDRVLDLMAGDDDALTDWRKNAPIYVRRNQDLPGNDQPQGRSKRAAR